VSSCFDTKHLTRQSATERQAAAVSLTKIMRPGPASLNAPCMTPREIKPLCFQMDCTLQLSINILTTA
jgi:hypothetical protein